MIDINQPVEKGHDMVLNNADGTQELGSAEEFAKRKEAGDLSGMHTDVPQAVHNELNEDKSMDKTKLDDEQKNEAVEERTEGEVEQTESVRDEAEKAEQDVKPEAEKDGKKDDKESEEPVK